MQLSEQEIVRRDKLSKLRDLGINPYPANLYPVDCQTAKAKSEYEEGKKVIIAGRIMSRRIQGNASFAELQDAEGKIQVYFNRDEICPGEDKPITTQFIKNSLILATLLVLKENYSLQRLVR